MFGKIAPSSKQKKPMGLVLIVGVAGFIGSRVANALCELGVPVLGLDTLREETDSLEKLRKYPNFRLIQADVNKSLDVLNTETSITHIVHAIDSYPHLRMAGERINSLLVNSQGLHNLLDLANKHRSVLLFTSAVEIYQGMASHDQLYRYYGGEELANYYAFLEAKRFGEAFAREYVEQFDVDVRVARLPMVYGPGMDLKSNHMLTNAMRLVLDGKDLVLTEEGSREHHLVYIDDVVYGLVKLLMHDAATAKGGIFYFLNPERVSTLSIAYSLKELIKKDNMVIEFLPEHRKIGWPEYQKIDTSRTEKILKWKPEVALTVGLRRTLEYFASPEMRKASLAPTPAPPAKPIVPSAANISVTPLPAKDVWVKVKKNNKPFLASLPKINLPKFTIKIPRVKFRVGTGVIVTSIALIFLFAPAVVMGAWTYAAWNSAEDLDLSETESRLERARSLLPYYRYPMQWIGMKDTYEGLDALYAVGLSGINLVRSVEHALTPLTPVQEILIASWQGAEIPEVLERQQTTEKAFGTASVSWEKVKSNFALFKREVALLPLASYPASLREKIETGKEYLARVTPLVDTADRMLGQGEQFLGFRRTQRYLVLLQNNTELRANGGFIGSYVVMEIKEGAVTFFKVDDIYNPDGLLKPHQDPAIPLPLREHLDMEFLGARDANWWANFPTSAQTVIELYDRATQESVTGVIALNLETVKKILARVGPLYLEEYDETVTADTVFEQAQLHAEIGFVAGSTQKKDYLGNVTAVLLESVFSGDKTIAAKLGEVFARELLSGDVMVYHTESRLQEVLSRMQVSGELAKSTGDYLRIVDTNVGGNKANYWVDRSTKYSVAIDRDGYLIGTAEITWKHRGKSVSWPGGDYQNYVRIYTPVGTTGFEVTPDTSEKEIWSEDGKVVVGTFVDVPINSEKTIQIRYLLPAETNLVRQNPYTLVWDKQPGIANEPISFSFDLPVFLSSLDILAKDTTLSWRKDFRVSVSGTETIPTDRGITPTPVAEPTDQVLPTAIPAQSALEPAL